MSIRTNRRGKTPWVALLCLTAAGCSTQVAEHRADVDEALRLRTGFDVGDGAGLPAGVDLAAGLTEDQAVALALWGSPAFQAALAQLGIARADVERAGLLANPMLSLLFPWGDKQLEATARLPLEALWLRPARLAAAELDHELVAELLVRDGLDLVRDVRQSWARLRAARRTAELLGAVAGNRERAAGLLAARVASGDATEVEGLALRAAALQAQLEATRAADAAAQAEERLRELLAPPLDEAGERRPLELRTEAARPELAPPAAQALVAEALAGRPEVRAGELALEAAAARAGLQRRDVLLLNGVIDANALDGGGLEVGPGLDIELPLFGRRSGPELTRAEAEAERAAWQLVGTQRRIEREVREALLGFERARRALETLRREVLPALDDLRRAAARAEQLGATGGQEPLDAEARWLAARRGEVELELELELARADLERSVGRRLE